MANTLTLAKEYIIALDKAYKEAAITSILEVNNQFMRQGTLAGEVLIPIMDMDGMGNYDRNTGFVDGSVSLTWQTYKMRYDRGRKFNVDEADNMETANLAFGMLAGEFTRTKVAPEVDATRFAALHEKAKTKKEIAITVDNIIAELKEMETAWNEAEVPQEGRVVFMSYTTKAILEQTKEFQAQRPINVMNNNVIENRIDVYNGMRIIGVPQSRFYSAITLQDGKTSGQTAGGYIKNATTGKDLNFLGVHLASQQAYSKIDNPRIFDPKTNQQARAWQYDYRRYHDLWVLKNKEAGVYSCVKP